MKSDLQTIYFKSKKNKVRLYQGHIEKYHKSPEAAKFEADRLTRLHDMGLSVPKLFSVCGNMLKMEYIPATPLPDLIDQWEEEPNLKAQEIMARGIVTWLADYYKAVNTKNTGETRGDINGRNFLFDGEKVWGVDFEERAFGSVEEDIGQLLAFVLTYHPDHTPLKQSLANIIACQAVRKLHLSLQILLQQQALALEIIGKRRIIPTCKLI